MFIHIHCHSYLLTSPGSQKGLSDRRIPLKIVDFQRFFFFTPVPVRRKITSQLPELDWYDAIGDTTVADAILDRIVHTTHRITLTGESVRKLKAFKGR